MYWLVMPTFHNHGGHAGVHFHIADVTAVVGVLGLWVGVFAWRLRQHALVPLRDPRMPESLAFENFPTAL